MGRRLHSVTVGVRAVHLVMLFVAYASPLLSSHAFTTGTEFYETPLRGTSHMGLHFSISNVFGRMPLNVYDPDPVYLTMSQVFSTIALAFETAAFLSHLALRIADEGTQRGSRFFPPLASLLASAFFVAALATWPLPLAASMVFVAVCGAVSILHNALFGLFVAHRIKGDGSPSGAFGELKDSEDAGAAEGARGSRSAGQSDAPRGLPALGLALALSSVALAILSESSDIWEGYIVRRNRFIYTGTSEVEPVTPLTMIWDSFPGFSTVRAVGIFRSKECFVSFAGCETYKNYAIEEYGYPIIVAAAAAVLLFPLVVLSFAGPGVRRKLLIPRLALYVVILAGATSSAAVALTTATDIIVPGPGSAVAAAVFAFLAFVVDIASLVVCKT